MKKLFNVGFWTILLAGLGIVVPIVWDYYKTTSAIELVLTGKSTIISKPEKMNGLVITYDGESLEELSRITFSIINTGRSPIGKKDVVSPIVVSFAKEAGVIDVKIDSMQPPNLGANLIFDKAVGSTTFDFPLLNPNDRIHFSVLAKTSNIKFNAAARIAGVSSLGVKDISDDKTKKIRPWTIYPVGFFSVLFLMVAFSMLLKDYPNERRVKRALKSRVFDLPLYQIKSDLIDWVSSTIGFLTNKDRDAVILFIDNFSDSELTNDITRTRIMDSIQHAVNRAQSNLQTGLLTMILSFWGLWYVFTNW
ncbi:MAG: hypothetical protein PHU06_10515 [Gallionella sp.]|nr:hypothetical protein [Gallionella sp.]MDD4959556.1 hypothetical protein [Gallionella sp.]